VNTLHKGDDNDDDDDNKFGKNMAIVCSVVVSRHSTPYNYY
jgi:hypothetical protein